MKVIWQKETAGARIVALGTFDGVHRGDRELLGRQYGEFAQVLLELTEGPPPGREERRLERKLGVVDYSPASGRQCIWVLDNTRKPSAAVEKLFMP